MTTVNTMNTMNNQAVKPTTNVFVTGFDIDILEGTLEVNDLLINFTVESLQELKEEYGAIRINEVFEDDVLVAVDFSDEVMNMVQDAIYEYAVAEYNKATGDD